MYTIPDTDIVFMTSHKPTVAGKPREYDLRFRDLPTEDRPREKLVEFGAHSLSIQELLAIVLATGTKKEDVMEMTKRIIKDYGEKNVMSEVDPSKIAKELDIPLIKACQIVACSELGRRFYKKSATGLAVIRVPKDVFEYVKDMRELPKEHLRGIYLDTHNRVIHDEFISIGTINSNIVHPREVFKSAIEYNAAAIILVHNHPSGVVTPSTSDVTITKQLIEAGKIVGINVLDHVIVTKDAFQSIDADY